MRARYATVALQRRPDAAGEERVQRVARFRMDAEHANDEMLPKFFSRHSDSYASLGTQRLGPRKLNVAGLRARKRDNVQLFPGIERIFGFHSKST